MGLESIKFHPEEKGADFSIYLQADIIRDLVKEGKDQAYAVLEWSRHSEEFRKLVDSDPKVKELFEEDQEEAKKYVKEMLGLSGETVN